MLPGCGLSVKFHRIAEVARNSICQMVMDCAGWRLTGVHTNPLWLGRAAPDRIRYINSCAKMGIVQVASACCVLPGVLPARRRRVVAMREVPHSRPPRLGAGECMRILPPAEGRLGGGVSLILRLALQLNILRNPERITLPHRSSSAKYGYSCTRFSPASGCKGEQYMRAYADDRA